MTVKFRDRTNYSELKVDGVSSIDYTIVTRGHPIRLWTVTKQNGDTVNFDKNRYNIISVAD